MNNSNGAALLARVRPGDLVTVRRPTGYGDTLTGRYRPNDAGAPLIVGTGGRFAVVTAANILSIQPRG